jgi:chemotaxis protein MotB
MSAEASAKQGRQGAPAWVMTFADLMSLLMCFFVLLLAFSEMDVLKYKEMAGSLKNAFGVQREIQVKEPPKGINVIAREFSPARPEPTQLNVIRQMTTNDLRVNLDLGKERRRPVPTPRSKHEPDRDKTMKPQDPAHNQADQNINQKAGSKADLTAGEKSAEQAERMPGKQPSQESGLSAAQKQELAKAKARAAQRLDQKLESETLQSAATVDPGDLEEQIKARAAAERRKKLERSAQLISNALGKEIKAGSVDVETAGQKIIIRVREKASFGSGRAELKQAFRPLLKRVTDILKGSEGKIIVAGHTDNVPIYTERFRSNWELSAARAVSVAHEMMLATDIPSERFLIQGFADTQPVAANDTAANRSKNRRVEIVLQQGEDKEGDAPPISGQGADGKRQPGPGRGAQAQTSVVSPKLRQAPSATGDRGVKVPGNSSGNAPAASREAATLGIKVGGGN